MSAMDVSAPYANVFVTACTNFVSGLWQIICVGILKSRSSNPLISGFFEFLGLVGMRAMGNVAQLLREYTWYESVGNLAKCS